MLGVLTLSEHAFDQTKRQLTGFQTCTGCSSIWLCESVMCPHPDDLPLCSMLDYKPS
jgi:hypothetical protein